MPEQTKPPPPEKWILGVDHEHPDKEEPARGSITRVCYLEPPLGVTSVDVTSRDLSNASRNDVRTWLDKGVAVFTAVREIRDVPGVAAASRIWNRGAPVRKQDSYITTEANAVTCDNLGALPSIATVRGRVELVAKMK